MTLKCSKIIEGGLMTCLKEDQWAAFLKISDHDQA